MLRRTLVVICLLALGSSQARATIVIDTVPVGNAGNAGIAFGPDGNPQTRDGTFGAVATSYRIGTYEVTNSQYTNFLNSVDPTGGNTRALYNSNMSSSAVGGINFNGGAADGSKYEIKAGRDNNPVVFVSAYDALRMANWLHNGQGTGSTETGAYTLNGADPFPIVRQVGAQWFLPTENEWFKAAYHMNDGVTGNYYDQPTQSNFAVYSSAPPGTDGSTNSHSSRANIFRDNLSDPITDNGYAVTGSPTFNGSQNYLTDKGAYTLSDSAYGTFDQGGNVGEMTQTNDSSDLIVRGGAWEKFFDSTDRFFGWGLDFQGGMENSIIGFRLASSITAVPESSPVLFGALATLVALVVGSFRSLRRNQVFALSSGARAVA